MFLAIDKQADIAGHQRCIWPRKVFDHALVEKLGRLFQRHARNPLFAFAKQHLGRIVELCNSAFAIDKQSGKDQSCQLRSRVGPVCD